MNKKSTLSRLRLFAGALALAILGMLAMPSAAFATTAANTQITNTASVTFQDDLGNQSTLTAQATAIIQLVAAAPTFLAAPAGFAINQGNPASLTYTIFSNANGPDTYAFSLSTNTPTTITAETPPSGTYNPTTLVLGASTVAQTTTPGLTLAIPYNPAATNILVNGLTCGNTIVIAGTTYKISSVAPCFALFPGTQQNYINVTMDSTTPVGVIPAGTQIGQELSFTWSFTKSGNVTGGGTTGSYLVATTATAASGAQPAAASGTTLITVNQAQLNVTKLVCDVTALAGCTPTLSTINSQPGHTLLYMLTAQNTSSAPSHKATFSDTLPPYVTYVASGSKSTGSGAAYSAAGALTDTVGVGLNVDDGFSFAGGQVLYNPNSATSGGLGAGAGASAGDIEAGSSMILYYEVVVN